MLIDKFPPILLPSDALGFVPYELRSAFRGTGKPALLCPLDADHFDVYYDFYRDYSGTNSSKFRDILVTTQYFHDGNWFITAHRMYTTPRDFLSLGYSYQTSTCYRTFCKSTNNCESPNLYGIKELTVAQGTYNLANSWRPFTDYVVDPSVSVSYLLLSIFIFIAIVACSVRLFIYPFWRKIRSRS